MSADDDGARPDATDVGGIATLTLNRPEKLNALTPAVFVELRAHVDAIAADEVGRLPSCSPGAGRSFCAGNDLGGHRRGGEGAESALPGGDDRCARSAPAADGREGSRPLFSPVVSSSRSGCDLIVASASAQLGDTHGQWGLVASWGMTVRLPERVGRAKAKELMFTARRIDGTTAAAIGLVNTVVDDDELDASVEALCAEIVGASWDTSRIDKALLDRQPRHGAPGCSALRAVGPLRPAARHGRAAGPLLLEEELTDRFGGRSVIHRSAGRRSERHRVHPAGPLSAAGAARVPAAPRDELVDERRICPTRLRALPNATTSLGSTPVASATASQIGVRSAIGSCLRNTASATVVASSDQLTSAPMPRARSQVWTSNSDTKIASDSLPSGFGSHGSGASLAEGSRRRPTLRRRRRALHPARPARRPASDARGRPATRRVGRIGRAWRFAASPPRGGARAHRRSCRPASGDRRGPRRPGPSPPVPSPRTRRRPGGGRWRGGASPDRWWGFAVRCWSCRQHRRPKWTTPVHFSWNTSKRARRSSRRSPADAAAEGAGHRGRRRRGVRGLRADRPP